MRKSSGLSRTVMRRVREIMAAVRTGQFDEAIELATRMMTLGARIAVCKSCAERAAVWLKERRGARSLPEDGSPKGKCGFVIVKPEYSLALRAPE